MVADINTLTTKKMNRSNAIQGAQSFHRAIMLLKLIANHNQAGMRLIDIVEITGLTVPTAHRLLQALIAEGLLHKIESTNLYVLGSLVYKLGFTAKQRFNLLQMLTPFVEVLAQKSATTALFFIKSDDDMVCLVRADSPKNMSPTTSLGNGSRRPLGTCAAGVALLSCLPIPLQQEITQRNSSQYIFYPQLSNSLINEEIKRAQQLGYAMMEDVVDAKVFNLALPICNHKGEALASIVISLSKSEQKDERYLNFLPSLRSAVEGINAVLGEKENLWEL